MTNWNYTALITIQSQKIKLGSHGGCGLIDISIIPLRTWSFFELTRSKDTSAVFKTPTPCNLMVPGSPLVMNYVTISDPNQSLLNKYPLFFFFFTSSNYNSWSTSHITNCIALISLSHFVVRLNTVQVLISYIDEIPYLLL